MHCAISNAAGISGRSFYSISLLWADRHRKYGLVGSDIGAGGDDSVAHGGSGKRFGKVLGQQLSHNTAREVPTFG